MIKPTPEQLDELFPDRHLIADEFNLHPNLRANFVPLHHASLTTEQRDAIFPLERRIPLMRDLVEMLSEQPHPDISQEQAS